MRRCDGHPCADPGIQARGRRRRGPAPGERDRAQREQQRRADHRHRQRARRAPDVCPASRVCKVPHVERDVAPGGVARRQRPRADPTKRGARCSCSISGNDRGTRLTSGLSSRLGGLSRTLDAWRGPTGHTTSLRGAGPVGIGHAEIPHGEAPPCWERTEGNGHTNSPTAKATKFAVSPVGRVRRGQARASVGPIRGQIAGRPPARTR